MTEKKVIVSGLTLKYTGLFDMYELFALIDRWCKENGYDREEHKHEVIVNAQGTQVDLEVKPNRTISDYIKHIIEMRIKAADLKTVTVEVDGKTRKLQEGTVSIAFGAKQTSDLEGKWVSNAFSYFFRVIMDKYLYSGYISDYEGRLKQDTKMLYTEISSYLNTNKYRFPQAAGERP